MKARLLALICAFAVCSFVNPALSQDDGTVPAKFTVIPEKIPAGSEAVLTILLEVPPAHHITSLDLGLFYAELEAIPGFTFKAPIYPPAKDFEGDKVFQGDTPVKIKFSVGKEVKPGDYTLKVSYGYQMCIETGSKMCYLPQNLTQDVKIKVVEAGKETAASAVDTTEPAATDSAPAQTPAEAEAVTQVKTEETLENRFTSALNQGSVLAFILVFIAGILSSLTPCVYPVIPITIGYIGGKSAGKKLQGFILSLFLTLGIAIVYSTLGIIAAATGSVFGSFTQNPIVILVIAGIFAVMGLSMLGLFEIQLPASMQSKMRTEKQGFLGALLVGMITGLVAAPCVGPVLVALLAWVAQTGSIVIGFFLLFTYAVGMGLLFIVIGTFAGAMTALPGAGEWMDTVKHVFGYILIGGAIFMMKSLMPEGWYYLLWGIFLIIVGVFSGALEILSAEPTAGKKWGKAIGVLLLVLGVVMFVDGYNNTIGFPKHNTAAAGSVSAPEKSLQWIVNDPEKAFTEAKLSGKGVIMDFYADWCAACVELDEKTWVDKELIDKSGGFVFLKMDLTKITPELEKIRDAQKIQGMPTVIFFDKSGVEQQRFAGFKPAKEVIDIMKTVN